MEKIVEIFNQMTYLIGDLFLMFFVIFGFLASLKAVKLYKEDKEIEIQKHTYEKDTEYIKNLKLRNEYYRNNK